MEIEFVFFVSTNKADSFENVDEIIWERASEGIKMLFLAEATVFIQSCLFEGAGN